MGKSIAVFGQKNFFFLDEVFDRQEPLSNISPHAGVNEGNAPVRRLLANNLNFGAKIRDDTIAAIRRLIVQEIVLDDVCLVSEAKNEIPMPMLAVILHEMPQNRLVTD